MVERITLKQFKEDLMNNETALIYNGHYESKDEAFSASKLVTDYINEDKLEYRTVEKNQTNAFKFSNGSWLYFDGVEKKQVYKDGRFRYLLLEYFGSVKLLTYIVKQ